MVRRFRIKTIVKKSESPFILTLNDNNQLIGDRGRALEGYIKKGMLVKAEGFTRGDDLLIENILFPEGIQKGVQLNMYA